MSDQGFQNPQLEQIAGKNKRLSFLVTLKGNTSAASIVGTTNCNVGAQVYTILTSATAPSDANFSGLVNATAPATIGIYIQTTPSLTNGDAKQLGGVTVPVNSIRSVSMTAGVVTNKGAVSAIAGNTGVTTNGNLAFQIACTTLDLDAQTADHTFIVDVEYDVL